MDEKKMTYEEAVTRLSEIVSALEGGEATLEESLRLFEEGAQLSTFCYETLSNARQKIEKLSGGTEGAQQS